MNKSEFISLIATKLDIPKKDASAYVSTIFDTLADTIAEGKNVHITRFGKFAVKPVAARKARNIHTGEPIHLPPSHRLVFSPSLSLKKRMNKK